LETQELELLAGTISSAGGDPHGTGNGMSREPPKRVKPQVTASSERESFVKDVLLVCLGVVLGVLATVAYDWYKRPQLRVDFASYGTINSMESIGDTTHLTQRQIDLVRRCRLFTLEVVYPPGVDVQPAFPGSLDIAFAISNEGRSAVTNLRLVVGIDSVQPDTVFSTSNVAISHAVIVNDYERRQDRVEIPALPGHTAAVVTFRTRFKEPSSQFTSKPVYVRAASVAANEIDGVVNARPSDALQVLALVQSLESTPISRSMSAFVKYKVPGAVTVTRRMLEWSGSPTQSFTGTCGYAGPLKDRADSIVVDSQTYVVRR
jgi:hypothetical protein